MINKHEGPHRYVRIFVGKKKRVEYKCSKPGCVHVCRKEYISGRNSICHYCNEPFILQGEMLRYAKPHCGCKTKKKDNVSVLAELFK